MRRVRRRLWKPKEEPQEEPQAARAVTESPKSDFSNLNNFTADTLGKGTFTQENFADKDVTVINFWALFADRALPKCRILPPLKKRSRITCSS